MSCYCQDLNEGKSEGDDKVICSICVGANVWAKLSTDEKSKAIAYKRIISKGKEPSTLMAAYINHLHELYEDFDIGAIP